MCILRMFENCLPSFSPSPHAQPVIRALEGEQQPSGSCDPRASPPSLLRELDSRGETGGKVWLSLLPQRCGSSCFGGARKGERGLIHASLCFEGCEEGGRALFAQALCVRQASNDVMTLFPHLYTQPRMAWWRRLASVIAPQSSFRTS